MTVQDVQPRRVIQIRARTAVQVGFGLVAAIALWLALYAVGVFPWLGYETVTRSSLGSGPNHFIIGENRAGGFSLGPRTFLFARGQTIVVSYDAEIRRGCLWMHVWNMFDHAKAEHVSQCVTKSGPGEWTVPVNQTGLYRIFIDASPIKGNRPGWDLSYSVWWGARW